MTKHVGVGFTSVITQKRFQHLYPLLNGKEKNILHKETFK